MANQDSGNRRWRPGWVVTAWVAVRRGQQFRCAVCALIEFWILGGFLTAKKGHKRIG